MMQKYGDTPLIVGAQKGAKLCVAVLTGLIETDITHQNSAGYVAPLLLSYLQYTNAIFMHISDAQHLLLQRCLTIQK